MPDGALIALPESVPTDALRKLGYTVHETEEASGANVLCLGQTVVVPSDAPATASRLRALGHVVTELDISELQKLEAGLTCMSVFL